LDHFDDIISALDGSLPQLRDLTYSQILGIELPGLQDVRDLNQAFSLIEHELLCIGRICPIC
jgi:hypothetical protein